MPKMTDEEAAARRELIVAAMGDAAAHMSALSAAGYVVRAGYCETDVTEIQHATRVMEYRPYVEVLRTIATD